MRTDCSPAGVCYATAHVLTARTADVPSRFLFMNRSLALSVVASLLVAACSSENGTTIQPPSVAPARDASTSPPDAPADAGAGADATTRDAADARDGANGTDAADASVDAATPTDAGAFTTLPTCEKLGVTCPAQTPTCGVTYDAASNMMVYTCTESLAAGGALDQPCDPVVVGGCQDGLFCGPFKGIGYRCAALCSADRDCPSDHPFCNVPLSWGSGVRALRSCARCNPSSTSECGFGKSCRVSGATAQPSCEAAGAKALDEACAGASDCAPGLVCGCGGGGGGGGGGEDSGLDAGTFGIGDECAAKGGGTCRPSCADWSRGQTWDCAGGGTCVGEGDGLYAYCKP